jgi:hypothetical protein
MNGADADAKHKEEEEDRRARRKVGQRLRETSLRMGSPHAPLLTSVSPPLDSPAVSIGGSYT